MIFFLCGAALSAAQDIVQAAPAAALLKPEPFVTGQWASAYEKNFNKNILLYEPSVNAWGLMNYALFRNGKDGVLVGEDNWLFTQEEFQYYPDGESGIAAKLDYIDQVGGGHFVPGAGRFAMLTANFNF